MNEQVSAPVGHPVLAALEAAAAAVAEMADAPVYGLVDADLEAAIEQCQALAAQVFNATLTLVREADDRDVGRRSGAASTGAWVAGRFRIRPGQARTLVRLAQQTRPDDGPLDWSANVRAADTGRELRATGAALADGDISPEHATVVARVMERVPAHIGVEEARTAEAELAGFCRRHDPAVVARLGEYLLSLLAADTLDEREAERHRLRQLRFCEATGRITGRLTTEGIALLRTALDPLAAPAPAGDGERDPRTAAQRHADALVELARRAIAADGFETNHGISHRVVVTIGLDTLTTGHQHPAGDDPAVVDDATGPAGRPGGGSSGVLPGPGDAAFTAGVVGGDGAAMPGQGPLRGVAPGEIHWGGLISPAAARRLACCAGIQRVILDPAGAVLDVGREYRTATPAQFAALTARDGGCVFPGCTRPASWCIAHHIIHWADGGDTNLDNLVLLCTWHHTVIHHHGWHIQLGPDRLPDFYPPPWIDPDRTPRRNTRPRWGPSPRPDQ